MTREGVFFTTETTETHISVQSALVKQHRSRDASGSFRDAFVP